MIKRVLNWFFLFHSPLYHYIYIYGKQLYSLFPYWSYPSTIFLVSSSKFTFQNNNNVKVAFLHTYNFKVKHAKSPFIFHFFIDIWLQYIIKMGKADKLPKRCRPIFKSLKPLLHHSTKRSILSSTLGSTSQTLSSLPAASPAPGRNLVSYSWLLSDLVFVSNLQPTNQCQIILGQSAPSFFFNMI